MPTTSGSHPTDEDIEQYSLGRLPEAGLVEEHLLVCAHCQERLQEVDEFVLAMRQAAAEMEEPLPLPVRRRTSLRSRVWALPKPLWAGGLAAAAVLVLLLPWQRRAGLPYEVQLQSYRGADTMLTSTAPSGRPLILEIDPAQLPDRPAYRVEVVDSSGVGLWESGAAPVEGRITLATDQSLDPGQYWVRVYGSGGRTGAGGELLSEFNLRVE